MKTIALLVFGLIGLASAAAPAASDRPRARDIGLNLGVLPPGPLNAITDVAGVRVGQVTLVEGADVRTGVTAILPHGGNVFQDKVPAGIAVGNGFGKLTGVTQVQELGTLETPVVLTNTLSVPDAARGVVEYVLSLPGNESVESVNPVVGETNDGFLNDIRARRVRPEHVLAAIRGASGGAVEEGAVGAGTGTMCFGFKGGIGTSSRRLPAARGGYTVGVLVQTNFGGVLRIAGVPAGQRLGSYMMKADIETGTRLGLPHSTSPRSEIPETGRPLLHRPLPKAPSPASPGEGQNGIETLSDGSCMIVVATDAPLDARNLRRLAARALLGIARTGGVMSNGSGDYAIAFSTADGVRVPHRSATPTMTHTILRDDEASALFLAAAEASEEAILNSLFKAARTAGKDGHVAEALPLDKVREILREPALK